MKVSERDIVEALDNPGAHLRFSLLYGPDEAGSRALASRLDRAMGSACERIDLDGAALREDPARLADEAASSSLFGGSRYIRVTGGDECAAAVAALLEAPVAGNPVVMIAGALKATSAVVKLALNGPAAVCFQSFVPEGKNAGALALSAARSKGLKLHPDSASRLAHNCLGDRDVLDRELEKIALFLDAAPDRPRELTDQALAAIGADLAEVDNTRLVDAILDGDLGGATRELASVTLAHAWVPAVRALQRRLIVLGRLRGEVEAGAKPATVMATSGKSLFWKERDAISRQLLRWDSTRLAAASRRLFASEGLMMSSQSAGHVVVAEEFVAIARVAARLR